MPPRASPGVSEARLLGVILAEPWWGPPTLLSTQAAWHSWQHHVRTQLPARCAAAWLSETARAYTFDEWQAQLAAHHWMGTWHHNHTVRALPTMAIPLWHRWHVAPQPSPLPLTLSTRPFPDIYQARWRSTHSSRTGWE